MDTVKQRQNARSFVKQWKDKGYEKGDTQKFWLGLIQNVLGAPEALQIIDFEKQVKIDGQTKFVDGYITRTKILIEQKGLNVDLSKKYRQSGGLELTPFEQAKRYAADIGKDSYPNYIVVSNFKEFLIHDMSDTSAEPTVIKLEDLPEQVHRFSFLVDVEKELTEFEKQVSVEAGLIVGEMYDALLKQYKNPESAETLSSLNKLCVRLVFCLYAEDSGLFASHSQFHDYLKKYSVNARGALKDLFEVLNTPEEEREYLNHDLEAFPYVNGGLFADEIVIPGITEEIVNIILKRASEGFDWKYISPTIFGAVFESTLNPETRRQEGMHYTSVENIHKVIDPLFLDDLKKELQSILELKVPQTKNKRLENYRKKLGSLTFLDPACGSGNFLTETYLSLRRLENEALRALYEGQLVLGEGFNPVYVRINQFYGIEINDFAVTVAQTALWIAESQMINETEDIVGHSLDFLPLKSAANIVEGNALTMDWKTVIQPSQLNYIMGNPPFVGHQYRTPEQRKEMEIVFPDLAKHGKLDYVCSWFNKSADFMKGTAIGAAFVSTNSICQGELVSVFWKYFLEKKIFINFAYRTFVWDNDSTGRGKAHVHVVVIGFSYFPKKHRVLFDENGEPILVDQINGYLLPTKDIYLAGRSGMLYPDLQEMTKGSQPTDGGFLLLSEDQRSFYEKNYPQVKPYIKKYVGSEEFINNKKRFCFWLKACEPNIIKEIPELQERLKEIRRLRESSPTKQVRDCAETPTLFTQDRQPNSDYIIVPETSSEKRKYIPLGFLSKECICSNSVRIIPNATLVDFSILNSSIHMAWMRTVAGRLEMRYRYSPFIYHNFPRPELSDNQKKKIELTAQKILDARKNHPNNSLAELYDPDAMPQDLREAHKENDRAVMRAYGLKSSMKEHEIVAKLFELYKEKVEELERVEAEKKKAEAEKKQSKKPKTKTAPKTKAAKPS